MTQACTFRASLRPAFLLGAALLAIAGCQETSIPGRPALSIREETAQFLSVPDSRRWVAVPGALLVQERDLGGDVEQRIALPNATTLEGDNMMLLRARVAAGPVLPRLQLASFADAEGRLPAPFGRASESALNTREDALGSVVYAERRIGVDTVCVLAMRRMPPTARPLPPQTEALDVMMRNCARGGPDEALRPIDAASLGFASPVPEAATATGSRRNLSPLAAPTQ
uniref:Lipoprotein n=1 Tax=Cereibacter sphaeroides (strain ATCC 17025 / ATH 2.4.3) TaxID=349102 RepID=A4WR48_CERS5